MSMVGKWDVFEAEFAGPTTGNPFLDVTLEAFFQQKSRVVRVPGFYDGDGIFRVRFMPDNEGEWSFVTKSNVVELDGKTALLVVWYDMLRLDSPAARRAGEDAGQP
jgi:hypothetical protein